MSAEKLRNALREGHVLHWYRIERVLGQGGFGITYLARDTNLDQYVAIKEYLPLELAVREGDFSVYPASQAQDERYRWGLDRFLAEARTLARFRHPAIVRVLSVFEANNTAYMVMEYQHGRSLQAMIERRRTLSEGELLGLLEPLLDGLDAMHGQGVIHRDIKPPNLFVREDGHPVLLDFGSARQALGQQAQTLTSVVSPGHAPFEQYYSKGDRQGPWTDIYGLGATLYRCVSGVLPMPAIDRSEAILRAERDIFVPAREVGEGRYSASFLAAIDDALAFDPKRRPQSVAAWRAQFDFAARVALIDSQPPLAAHGEDDAITRFSALSDESFDVTTGSSFDPTAAQARPPSGERRGTSAPVVEPVRVAAPISAPAERLVALFSAIPSTAFDRAPVQATLSDARALATMRGSQAARVDEFLAAAARDVEAGQLPGQQAEAALARGELDAADAAIAQARLLDSGDPGYAELAAKVDAARVTATAARTRAADIDGLLAAAAADLGAGRLSTPAGNNALERYRRVLALEPGNKRAARGINDVHERYLERVDFQSRWRGARAGCTGGSP